MFDRPHVEFIQAQMLPWQRIGPGRARPDAEYKILSRDNTDGACTTLIRYPPGWRRLGPEFLTADEEFYVLDGQIRFDDQVYAPDSYGFFPAGVPHGEIACEEGAVVLSCFSADPVAIPGEGAEADAARATAIPHIDALHMPWDMTLNDEKLRHLGISRKDLREDPKTGERSFLSMILPHSEPPDSRGPRESHPVVEEAYIISGSLVGPQGEMFPGAYFWRPPGIPHGPFGTRWGCVALIRFLGGQHVNVWSSDEAPFSFDTPYRPVLPEEMAHLARRPWMPAPRY